MSQMVIAADNETAAAKKFAEIRILGDRFTHSMRKLYYAPVRLFIRPEEVGGNPVGMVGALIKECFGLHAQHLPVYKNGPQLY